jgi:transaldolase
MMRRLPPMHDLKRDRGMLEFTLKAFKDETVAEEGHDFAATVTGCASLALDYLTLCEHQQRMIEAAEELLREIQSAGVSFEDERVAYVEIQVHKETLKAIDAFLMKRGEKDA